MPGLELPPFKSNEIEFIPEYFDVLAPLEIAIGRFRVKMVQYLLWWISFKSIYCRDKLVNLNAKAVKYCGSLIKAVSLKVFKNFPQLEKQTSSARVDNRKRCTRQYFKLSWVTFARRWNYKKKEFVSSLRYCQHFSIHVNFLMSDYL